jgi:hypothetical protein
MSSWVEAKYIGLLSYRFDKFKKKSENLYNFRCPLCGDSEKSRTKARGYFYSQTGEFWFICHNCSVNLPFPQFLKNFDSNLYKQFKLENLSGHKRPKKLTVEEEKKFIVKEKFGDLLSIPELKNNHPAKKYVESRKIPVKYVKDLYWCEEFKAWTNTQIKDKFEDLEYEEERIIIPFRGRDKKIFGYQGRVLYESPVKYITILFDELSPKVFNLNNVDFNYPYYVFEGPIDSMFLPNAIATAGGKISSELSKIQCNRDNAIVVYDNEPRNKQVVRNINSAIAGGYKVVIWPKSLEFKDINLMILNNYTSDSILQIMKDNTFKGLEAELQLNAWKKTG